MHDTQPEPTGPVGIGWEDSRFEGRARVDDGDSQMVSERRQLEQDRLVGADLSVHHAVGHQLADDHDRVRGPGDGDSCVELREEMSARAPGSPSAAGDQDRVHRSRARLGRDCHPRPCGVAARPGRGAARSSNAPIARGLSPRPPPVAEVGARPSGGRAGGPPRGDRRWFNGSPTVRTDARARPANQDRPVADVRRSGSGLVRHGRLTSARSSIAPELTSARARSIGPTTRALT